MSIDDENEQMARAMALSLQGLEAQLHQHEQEDLDLKVAIAASLGKTVDQLTARDMLLSETPKRTTKRLREEDDELEIISGQHRVLKRFDNSNTQFWNGVIKLTYVKGFIGSDYIRFEEIVQKTKLKKALVTAFVCSMDFINDHFPMDVNMCIVTHGRPAMKRQVHSHRIIIQPPLKDDKYGVFHPKLMLLFYEDHMRVVIGSANMERYDYEELENVVFIQDFPKLTTPPLKHTSELPEFTQDICDLLDRMQVPASVKNELLLFDFSKAKAHIVASVSGVFEGEEEYKKYGHTRLANVVNNITNGNKEEKSFPNKIEMQTSSLGSMTVFYLQELYKSFCGISAYNTNGRPSTSILKKNELPPIDIIYPTKDTVLSSRLGAPGAGTICLNTSTWRKPTFPKQVMCDAISNRQGTLMHSKYIIASLPSSIQKPTTKTEKLKGWLYCGSHNATVSAWGKFTIARDSKQPKMNISNWELGVVLPIFEDTDVPAPYLRPAPRYQPNQDAWTQDMEW